MILTFSASLPVAIPLRVQIL